jgi:hypothetical protein
MSVSKPQTKSSSDIELSVLTSPAPSFQPPPERVTFSSPISETSSIAMVDGAEPPTPAYFPPSNIPPIVPSSDAGLLQPTRLHGQSEIPLSSRQREDDRTSVQAYEPESNAEALPAYRVIFPRGYYQRRHNSEPEEPMTWPAISFRIGFRTFFHQIKMKLR